jgi:hypothetical protein
MPLATKFLLTVQNRRSTTAFNSRLSYTVASAHLDYFGGGRTMIPLYKTRVPNYKTGRNVAIKIPAHEYESTLHFYREVLSLQEIGKANKPGEKPRFRMGEKVLWLDCVASLSQTETWLEILSDDLEATVKYFEEQGCARQDHHSPLPDGGKGFWLSNPSNIIHWRA